MISVSLSLLKYWNTAEPPLLFFIYKKHNSVSVHTGLRTPNSVHQSTITGIAVYYMLSSIALMDRRF
jgi:hypothetical protein